MNWNWSIDREQRVETSSASAMCVLIGSLVLMLTVTCKTSAQTPLRIMPLGDSITVGYTDNPGWTNHQFEFGYRSGLYTRLTNAGYNFQFVGGSTEPWTGISGDPTHGGTYTPPLDLRDFGQDGHRGYGGAGIWNNVNGWIAADNPDIILLLIGINGISSDSPAALNTLVNNIVTTAPDVELVVAQITPRVSFNQNLFDYNVYIRDTLVPTYAGNGHKVATVDLYSMFLTDPNDYTSAIAPGVLSNNINHPTNAMYDQMAQAWFDGIELLDFELTFADADFDMDGDIDGADWNVYVSFLFSDTSGLATDAEKKAAGDFNLDGFNNHDDFVTFRTAYDLDNGLGSFAAMIVGTAVPEPSSILLLAVGAVGLGLRRRKRAC